MRRAALLLPLLLGATPVPPGAPPPVDWSVPVTGRLANGVRYAVLPRTGHEPGVGVLMRVAGGFLAERRPGERGLAHLIEHIAFLSPTTAAPDALRRVQTVGLPLTLPAPNAGSTSWGESNYYFATRGRAGADLATLLGLLREVAGGLTLRADAVDIARGEVIREMADKAHGNAVYGDYIAAVAPGSPDDVIDRQNSDDVADADVATIRALYRRLYRPEATMIVVVGAVEPNAVARAIAGAFGDWRAAEAAAPRPVRATVRPDAVRPASLGVRPDGRRAAMLSLVMPTPPAPGDEAAAARAELRDRIAVRAVTDRLHAARPGSASGTLGLLIEDRTAGHRQVMLWDRFAAGGWRAAAGGLRRVACDLSARGFGAGAWAAAARAVRTDLEREAGAMAGEANVALAVRLSHAVADGRPLVSPAMLLAQTDAVMDGAAADRWWRAQWRRGAAHLRVEAPELAGVPGADVAVRAVAGEACPAG